MLARPHPLRRLSRSLASPAPRWEWVFFALSAFALLLTVGYLRVKISEPASLTGDHLFLLATAKSLIKGYGFRFDPQLGYPEPRDWLYFPSFDETYRIGAWIAARLTTSPFVLVHMLYVAGLTAMACAYYWTLRRLGISAWLAVIGSLAGALTPYVEERIYFQDALALSFSVPLGLGLALQIGRSASTATLGSFFKDPFVLLSMLVVGASGLYYAFYSVLIAVFIGLAAAVGERRVFPVVAALLIAEVVLVLLVLSGYGLDFPAVLAAKGGVPQPQRYAFEQPFYGLDLAGAADRFTFLRKVAVGVGDTRRLTPYYVGDGGAWPPLALTITILAAPFIVVAGEARLRTLKGTAEPKLRLVVLCAAVVLFLTLFGARGGLGYLFNLLATPQIRSDDRVLPFLGFGAVIILCLLAEIARDSSRRWVRYGGPIVIGLVLLAGAAGSMGAAARVQSHTLADPKLQALRASLQGMLAAKDGARLQVVLQLPVISWPETLPPRPGFHPYQQQLPYIFDSPASATRWSYGANERQAGFRRLQKQTASLEDLDDRVRRLGFDSVLVEKRAYAPQALATIQAAVGGAACRLYEDQTYALYSLACPGGRPGGDPTRPAAGATRP